MTTEPIGIYVHIPFCKSKCAYCDFVSFQGALEKYEQSYTEALVKEIYFYKTAPKIKADTVFFGGGTPSVISEKSFAEIAKALYDTFDILPSVEFTIESNPKTLSSEKLRVYTSLGVNRISLGLQSCHKKELKILGRIHNFEDFESSYELAQKHGISNVNVDLMYALPGQKTSDFVRSLDRVLALCPPHISAYSLILEEGTKLFDMKDSLSFPTEEEECEMYEALTETLRNAGYLHYEISNYAKAGFECRHNLKYWQDREYIGFGLAAHSYYGKKRYSNPTSFSEYFSLSAGEYIQTEEITPADNAYEYAMMHLRLSNGFSLSEYKRRFSTDFLLGREAFIFEITRAGYMKIDNDRIRLTEKGFYVSNEILSRLL